MESTKYICIFENVPCPAKTAYKLSPESLAQFCKVCVEKTKWDTIMQAMKMMAEMATSLQKNTNSDGMEPKIAFDLQLEKAKLNHDIELKKLELEEKKFEYGKTVDDKFEKALKDRTAK